MSDKNWIVKAFHTGGPYEKDADKLKASADKLGIPIDIEIIKSRGSWNANTHYKPQSIIEAMLSHPNIDYIIHVDADAWFMQYPALFDKLDCDISVFYWGTGMTWCSGTVVVRNSIKMSTFMKLWDRDLRANPKQHGDQAALGNLLNKNGIALNIQKLPAGYLQGLAPNVKKGMGVIAHDGARKRHAKDGIYSEPK